jgi:FixJ family two-component response regulator
LSALTKRLESLTSREREIMVQVVQGRLSKQIAHDFGISDVTVKVHRSNLMRKLNVHSVLELGRLADKLNLVAQKR